MNINPSVSVLLNEACHALKSPGEPDPSRIIPVKKEELSNSDSDCVWLNYDEEIKLDDNRRLDGREFNLLTKCDASPELELGGAYLKDLKAWRKNWNETFRRFFEDKLLQSVKTPERFRKATFCNPVRASQKSQVPKPADIFDWGFGSAVYENYGTRVCGPDGAFVQCDDMKETGGLLCEACHLKRLVERPLCEEPTTSPSSSEPGAKIRRKDLFAVGLTVLSFAALLLAQG